MDGPQLPVPPVHVAPVPAADRASPCHGDAPPARGRLWGGTSSITPLARRVTPQPYTPRVTDALYPNDDRRRVFTLASTGEVELLGLEVGVVDTPEFQRLAGLRQLGTSNFVFRSAVHSRFEHSLGTLAMAEHLLDAAHVDLEDLEEADRRTARQLARLGALLHDLPHLPFGHTLEDEFGLLPRHDKDPERWQRLLGEGVLHDRLMEGLGADLFGELDRVLQAKSEREIAALRFPFIADIVGNTVCADLLDYIVRDLQACGMPVALGQRFLSYFVITRQRVGGPVDIDSRRMALRLEKRGMPRPDVESEVVKLLTYRYELAERVYFHHAKNAASVMIGRAVQELGLVGDPAAPPDPDTRALPLLFLNDGTALSDDLLLHCLANPEVAVAVGLQVTGDHERRARAAALGSDLLNRRLYKLAYLGVHDDLHHRIGDIVAGYGKPAGRAELEDRLAAELGLPTGDVLAHIPPQRMMVKAAEVRVERSDGTVTTMEGWDRSHSNRVDSLNDAHKRLWRVMVFVKPGVDLEATEKRRRLVGAAAADVFGAASRYVPAGQPPAPAGWHESELIGGLGFLQAEVAREIAVDRHLATAQVEEVAGIAADAVSGFGPAITLDQITGAWSAALPEPIAAPPDAAVADGSPTLDFQPPVMGE